MTEMSIQIIKKAERLEIIKQLEGSRHARYSMLGLIALYFFYNYRRDLIQQAAPSLYNYWLLS
jgi:hypothetical protein